MSVLVKGMEMPKNCDTCFVRVMRCKLYLHGRKHRHPNCPLIEIKEPHGRIGDLDELKSKFRHSEGNDDVDSAWISAVRRAIEQAETIVEAEGG